jgi:outer membrane protein TolC
MPLRLAVVGLSVLLASCAGLPNLSSVQSKPLVRQEMAPATQSDAQRMQQGVEPFTGPLTLDEAMARALKYNLDRRSRVLEEALAQRQLDSAALEMLPRLVADAGYSWRDNDRVTVNRDTSGGLTSPSVSQDRSRSLGGLEFTWSLLDLSLGYHATRQQGDRALAAGERKRKAMHLLLQDVRTAFFRRPPDRTSGRGRPARRAQRRRPARAQPAGCPALPAPVAREPAPARGHRP